MSWKWALQTWLWCAVIGSGAHMTMVATVNNASGIRKAFLKKCINGIIVVQTNMMYTHRQTEIACFYREIVQVICTVFLSFFIICIQSKCPYHGFWPCVNKCLAFVYSFGNIHRTSCVFPHTLWFRNKDVIPDKVLHNFKCITTLL